VLERQLLAAAGESGDFVVDAAEDAVGAAAVVGGVDGEDAAHGLLDGLDEGQALEDALGLAIDAVADAEPEVAFGPVRVDLDRLLGVLDALEEDGLLEVFGASVVADPVADAGEAPARLEGVLIGGEGGLVLGAGLLGFGQHGALAVASVTLGGEALGAGGGGGGNGQGGIDGQGYDGDRRPEERRFGFLARVGLHLFTSLRASLAHSASPSSYLKRTFSRRQPEGGRRRWRRQYRLVRA
jgi:hypothetical protein